MNTLNVCPVPVPVPVFVSVPVFVPVPVTNILQKPRLGSGKSIDDYRKTKLIFCGGMVSCPCELRNESHGLHSII